MRLFDSTIRIKVKELPFFSAYGIFLLFSVLSTSLYYKYISGAIYAGIILMCMGIAAAGEIFLGSKYNTKQQYALIITIILYAIISYTSSGFFTTVGIIPILLFSARNIDFRKIAWFSAVMMFFILLFVILSAEAHIIRNLSVVSINGRHREFLGFRFPLNPATIAFNISALWVYYKKEKLHFIEIFFLLGLNAFIFIKTDSKLAFASSVIVLVMGFMLKYCCDFVSRRRAVTFFICLSFIIAFGISLAFALTYDGRVMWMKKLNRFTEDRVYFANLSLKEYGVTLFGEDIPWVGFGTEDSGEIANNVKANYFYVDNMYIQVMQRYGLLFFGAYIFLNTVTMLRCRKNNDMYALLILAVIAYKCIIDNLSFYIYYNTFWFMICYAILYKRKSILEDPTVRRLLRKLDLI